MKSKFFKFLLVLGVVALFWMLEHYDLYNKLSITYLKDNLDRFEDYYSQHTFLTTSIFMGVYILTTALSIPGATILTLGGGALFGLWKGLLIVSFASTIGATLAFLASRFILRNWVQEKFGDKLKTINQGVERDGAFYLFTLRLIPLFPFFLINLIMGLTPIKVWTFYWVSQLGMFLGTFVYVNAGSQLSKIESLEGIVSPSLIGSFVALGMVPWFGRMIINFIKARKAYKGFRRPSQYDYNMVVIGGGSAGLVTSYICATVKAKVALIEMHKMGGDCLNTGCVPSKALIKSAKIASYQQFAQKYGMESINVKFDFAKVMERVQKVIKEIEPHDSIERYTKLGVDCITGKAKIISPWEIEVNGKKITTKNITIATGASPFVPPIPGLKDIDFLTSENLWDIRELPNKFLVLGAGPIGLELAQCFNRLGSDVTIVERGSRIMTKEDPEISEIIYHKLQEEGVKILLNHSTSTFKNNVLICESEGKEVEIPFDKVLVAVGRKANTQGFGLSELGIKLRDNGTIEANDFLQTNFPNIYVCGDVTGPFQLTHTASHQAWYCAVNALFGKFKKFRVDYSVIPWATYTDPEVATVGHNEESAKKAGIEYEMTRYGINDLDRAIADSEAYGQVKVLTKPGSDKILGATIVGQHASDLLLEFVSAMKNDFGLNKILATIHPYPTMGEANKYLAGTWKRERTPTKLLKLVQKYHKWVRK